MSWRYSPSTVCAYSRFRHKVKIKKINKSDYLHSSDFLISVFLIQLAIAVIAAISSKLSVLLFLFGFLSSGSLEVNSQWRSFASANAMIRRLFCFLCSFLKVSQRVSTIDLTSKKFISVVLNFTSFASHHTTMSNLRHCIAKNNSLHFLRNFRKFEQKMLNAIFSKSFLVVF